MGGSKARRVRGSCYCYVAKTNGSDPAHVQQRRNRPATKPDRDVVNHPILTGGAMSAAKRKAIVKTRKPSS